MLDISVFALIPLSGQHRNSACFMINPIMVDNFAKVKVGNDQEMTQSERNSHSKNEGGKKTELTIKYLY